MDNKYEYKSKVTKIYDFHNVGIEDFIPAFTIDQVQLEKTENRIIAGRGKRVEAEIIALGDVVEISCKSELPRFNKESINVNIGKNLFSKELENFMVGMKLGEEKEFLINDTSVIIHIKKIMHTFLPDLSEEEQREIRRDCIDRQIERMINEDEEADMASALICQKVAELSEFELSEEEMETIHQKVQLQCTPEATPEMEEMMAKIYMNSFKTSLIGCHCMKEDGICLIDEEYDRVKEYESVREFMDIKYADYYIKMVDSYVAEKFKNALNPERR